MPVYRYRNLATNEVFDHTQRITEPALTAHPETGDPVKRLIQPVGIAFKGSGFYVNDSRSNAKPNGKAEKSEKGEKADKTDGAKTEGSSDSGAAKNDKSEKTDKKADKPASKSAGKTESKSAS